ncbi:MAG TPA: DNA-binding domain-containing protein [Sphingomicrobium sp.]|nr:DNA-binding domain-containing protein [Sphingomicrobium sp.]
MLDLASFQKAFAAAAMTEGQPGIMFRSHAFAVYRNTSARGAVEALRASYPTVDALIGSEMFTEVALDFRRGCPPNGPVLSDYGANFADYLALQPWTSELPYLADVGRLDWLWLESFLAAGAETLPRPLDTTSHIRLHPAARFVWLETPALTIWQAHRDPAGFDELEPEWRAEGALFARPGLHVRVEPIEPDCHRLLLCASAPIRIGDLAAAVGEAYPDSDVPELLRRCIAAGALIIQ